MAITRQEKLFESVASGTPSGITPITREEQYLSYIAGESSTYPTEPITRKEVLLKKIAESGTGGGSSGGGSDETLAKLIDRSITEIDIPYGVTTVGDSAFYYCTKLTSITIPNSVTSIGDKAFSGCTKLTSITIPNSVTSIGSSTFSNCIFTSITIPNSVTSIGSNTFYGCTKLTSITIPNSVTSIGKSAFSSCNKLTDIYVGWSEGAVEGAPWGAKNATIHYNSEV